MRDSVRTALSHAAVVIALAAVPSAAFAQAKPWTTVASAGTVDEDSLTDVVFSGAAATISDHSRPSTIATIRYNVVAVDDIVGSPGISLDVRFLDATAGDQIVVKLRRMSYTTGSMAVLMTLDSNNFASSSQYQTQSVCDASLQLDFSDNAYFVEVTLKKGPPNLSSPSPFAPASPAIAMIRLIGDTCSVPR